jgi:hypothetical protein
MKKFLFALVISFSLLLAACEWEGPPGFDYDFYNSSKSMFDEIDEDTQELEMSDRDDRMNFKNLARKDDSEQEALFISNMEILLQEQEKIIKDEDHPLDKYLDSRNEIANILDINLYEFEFTEED